jgi:hypothetical protein
VEHRILWAVAMIIAATALFAGCLNLNVPEGPYVVAGNTTVRPPSAAEQKRVAQMDRPALENEVLRLTGENDALRRQADDLKRDNKVLKAERDRYKDDNENLRDQLKKTR